MALDAFFERIATPYVALLALLLLIGSTVALQLLNPQKEIQESLKKIDAKFLPAGATFGYRPDDLYQMLRAFNKQDSDHQDMEKYRRFIYYDFVYALFYALTMAILVAYLQRKLNLADAETGKDPIKTHYLWMVPTLAGVFDCVENISLLLILRLYDGKEMPILVGFSRFMTMLKLIFICASLLLVLFSLYELIVLPLYRRIKLLFQSAGAQQMMG